MNSLDALSEKIYQEGVEKARKASDELLQEAEEEKKRILAGARKEAQNIRDKAREDSEQLKRSVQADIRLKGRQAISDLKIQLRHLLSEHLLVKPLDQSFSDPAFLQQLITRLVEAWQERDKLEVFVPAELEEEIKKTLDADMVKYLRVNGENFPHTGFRIMQTDAGLALDFTPEAFSKFLEPYLEERTRNILFRNQPLT